MELLSVGVMTFCAVDRDGDNNLYILYYLLCRTDSRVYLHVAARLQISSVNNQSSIEALNFCDFTPKLTLLASAGLR